MLSFISAIQMNGRRIFSRTPGVLLESSSANARFPRHGQSADRGGGLRVYLFFASIPIVADGTRMETSDAPFDLRSIAGIGATKTCPSSNISAYDIFVSWGASFDLLRGAAGHCEKPGTMAGLDRKYSFRIGNAAI
ncbi:hypothetical protein [Bradyrhizobium sp. Ce-3]|uniref:hypothetical protein n=1 Tax=Bradyrhizobium sp. Ce-3 TaxID=2913970 RepID=UPI001FC84EC0|nr:hypothetical protein [Bradyrhizobium sp. Ce-3]